MDLHALGERTVVLDCDVIQADGGTRTASITGASVALYELLFALHQNGELPAWPLRELVAAVSVGIGSNGLLLDIDYCEDHAATADFSLVMTESGKFVEFQGTAESSAFDEDQISQVIELGRRGIRRLFTIQRSVLPDKGQMLRRCKLTGKK
jgi:ribonuclease PH